MFYFLFQSTLVLKTSVRVAFRKINMAHSYVIVQTRFHRFLRQIVQLCFFFFFLNTALKKKKKATRNLSITKRKLYSFLSLNRNKKKVLGKVSKLGENKKTLTQLRFGKKSVTFRKIQGSVIKKRFNKSSKTALLRKELLNVIKFLIEPAEPIVPFFDNGRTMSASSITNNVSSKTGFQRQRSNKFNRYKTKGRKNISPYIRYLNAVKQSLSVVIGKPKTKAYLQNRRLSFSRGVQVPLLAPNQIFMWRHLELNISLGVGLILPLNNLHFYSFMLDNPYLWRHLLVEYHTYFK